MSGWISSRMVVFTLVMPLMLPAAAQQRPRAPAPPPAAAEPAPELPLIYEPQLLALSEAMGIIAFISQLCGDPDSDSWRVRAEQLMDAEAGSKARRERLAGAYNRGFLGHQAAHRTCTDRSRQVLDRMIGEARTITLDLSNRFGG